MAPLTAPATIVTPTGSLLSGWGRSDARPMAEYLGHDDLDKAIEAIETEASALTTDERAELILLRRNQNEDTPGPWIQRAFDALGSAKANARWIEQLEAVIEDVASIDVDTLGIPLHNEAQLAKVAEVVAFARAALEGKASA